MRVLVLNAGSSTLKWALLDGASRAKLDGGSATWAAPDPEARGEEVLRVVRQAPSAEAVGHRVVHGGERFRAAVVIDAAVRAELERLACLDRMHMTPALAGIDAARAARPEVPQVAAFDTAFHATLPEAAAGYALPFEWTDRWGLKRYGFHGLSVQHAVRVAGSLLPSVPARIVVCHLGSGCSVTAVGEGRSVDTTMGFTPLDGVMMATRSGSVDPGLLLHLQARCGVGREELEDALTNRSGLLGVSGVSGDLRQVLAAEARSPRARLAYARFVWTLKRAVGAMAAVLGGVDAMVFTGGIGERSARVRGDVAAALGFAGLRLEREDDARAGDRVISAAGSVVSVLVVEAREELVILDEVTRLVGRRARPG